jgi:hypothetical protein
MALRHQIQDFLFIYKQAHWLQCNGKSIDVGSTIDGITMFEDSTQEVDRFDACTSNIATNTFCCSMPQEARFET